MVAVAVDLDPEPVQLRFHRGGSDLVHDFLAAGQTGGLRHTDRIADPHLGTGHGLDPAAQIVAGRQAQITGQVVGALNGLTVGLVADARERQRIHKRGIADTQPQAADWNSREVAVGARIEIAQECGNAGDLALLRFSALRLGDLAQPRKDSSNRDISSPVLGESPLPNGPRGRSSNRGVPPNPALAKLTGSRYLSRLAASCPTPTPACRRSSGNRLSRCEFLCRKP